MALLLSTLSSTSFLLQPTTPPTVQRAAAASPVLTMDILSTDRRTAVGLGLGSTVAAAAPANAPTSTPCDPYSFSDLDHDLVRGPCLVLADNTQSVMNCAAYCGAQGRGQIFSSTNPPTA